MCVCVCVCVMCERGCVCARACACVRANHERSSHKTLVNKFQSNSAHLFLLDDRFIQ